MKIFKALFITLLISQGLLVAQDSKSRVVSDLRNEMYSTEKIVRTEWIGHMGSRGPFVQNTTEAFVEGAKRGYYGIEMDLRVSSDGVFYICHDDTFKPYLFADSTLHGQPMGTFRWDELKDLEIKNTRDSRVYYSTLTRFEEYLQIIKDNDVTAIIELKWTNGINNNDTSNVKQLISLVKSYGVYGRAIFFTSMQNVLDHIRSNYADANLMFLSGATTTTQENINWAIENNISMGILHTVITEDIVSQLHRVDLKVNAYTVNSEEDAERLRNINVDFITTEVLGQ